MHSRTFSSLMDAKTRSHIHTHTHARAFNPCQRYAKPHKNSTATRAHTFLVTPRQRHPPPATTGPSSAFPARTHTQTHIHARHTAKLTENKHARTHAHKRRNLFFVADFTFPFEGVVFPPRVVFFTGFRIHARWFPIHFRMGCIVFFFGGR